MTNPSHLELANRLDTPQNDRSPNPGIAGTHPLALDDGARGFLHPLQQGQGRP